MAILIPSKNIYNAEAKKIVDNNIDYTDIHEYSFVGEKKSHEETITLGVFNKEANSFSFAGGEGSFGENVEYKNIQYHTVDNHDGQSWMKGYYVSFYYDIDMGFELAPLENLSVKTTNHDSDERVDIWQIYNPKNSSDFAFYLVKNELDFNNKTDGNWGKCGLQRIGATRFRFYLKILYLVVAKNAYGKWSAGDAVAYSTQRSFTFYCTPFVVISQKRGNVGSKKGYSVEENTFIQSKSIDLYGKTIAQKISDKILADYKNGKETATILCGINNYYDDRGFLIISTTKKPSVNDFYGEEAFGKVRLCRKISNVYPSTPAPYGVSITAKVQNKTTGETIDVVTATIPATSSFVDTKISGYGTTIKILDAVPVDYDMKMSFDLHDIVIPMVMGSDGKDYPMSRNKDNTPKLFEVVGVKKYYDGAVWQELTLQEYKTI